MNSGLRNGTRPQRLQAIFFDWAGTTIDYGSRAPTEVFFEVFRRRDVEITPAEARGPMGMAKRDHLAAISALPRVAEAWRARYGSLPADADIQRMYDEFLPLQYEVLKRGSDLIPGVVPVVDECRRRGLKIGSSTGYTRELMQLVAPIAAKQGYSPDVIVCPDEVRQGRPAPWLNFRIAEHLDIYPLDTVVVVDDTPVGIQAGLNAGAWTVAISETGNSMGLSESEVAALPESERQARLDSITAEFLLCGAHYVIRSVADLPGVLDQITERLACHGA